MTAIQNLLRDKLCNMDSQDIVDALCDYNKEMLSIEFYHFLVNNGYIEDDSDIYSED